MDKSANFSSCRKYRYSLRRVWNPDEPIALFIGLNPSTADEEKDDPTIRRCIGIAGAWGFGGLIMCNLFAARSADPDRLGQFDDPVGPGNCGYIEAAMKEASKVICCWGRNPLAKEVSTKVLSLLPASKCYCIEKNRDHSPRHPLYVPRDCGLQPYAVAR